MGQVKFTKNGENNSAQIGEIKSIRFGENNIDIITLMTFIKILISQKVKEKVFLSLKVRKKAADLILLIW